MVQKGISFKIARIMKISKAKFRISRRKWRCETRNKIFGKKNRESKEISSECFEEGKERVWRWEYCSVGDWY